MTYAQIISRSIITTKESSSGRVPKCQVCLCPCIRGFQIVDRAGMVVEAAGPVQSCLTVVRVNGLDGSGTRA